MYFIAKQVSEVSGMCGVVCVCVCVYACVCDFTLHMLNPDISGSRLKHFKNKTKLAQGSIDASKFMQNFLLLWAERKAMSSNSKNSYSKLLVSFYIIWVFWGVQRYNHNFVIWCRCWKSIVVMQLWKLLFWFHTKYSIWNIQLNQKDH